MLLGRRSPSRVLCEESREPHQRAFATLQPTPQPCELLRAHGQSYQTAPTWKPLHVPSVSPHEARRHSALFCFRILARRSSRRAVPLRLRAIDNASRNINSATSLTRSSRRSRAAFALRHARISAFASAARSACRSLRGRLISERWCALARRKVCRQANRSLAATEGGGRGAGGTGRAPCSMSRSYHAASRGVMSTRTLVPAPGSAHRRCRVCVARYDVAPELRFQRRVDDLLTRKTMILS